MRPGRKTFSPHPSRRAVLGGAGALMATTGFGPLGCAQTSRGHFRDGPFTLGIASGDPLADGVVLWTRLAPRPHEADGGMGAARVKVRWQVAHDPKFARLVHQGVETAAADTGHTVHAEVGGLEPARTYYYRFIAGGVASAIGRTRTAPAPGAMPDVLRFANVGCQNYEDGFYAAYGHLAREELDLVIHTGDYIYEKKHKKWRGAAARRHPDYKCVTLDQYRLRYALYKSDPDLKAAHAAHPFAVIFDDHEVANNWAADRDGDGTTGSAFMARRAAAFQAWWEHMPVRRTSRPNGPHIQLYRGLDYGRLARISLCDTRQYRTPQPCGGGTEERCGGDSDRAARMLGRRQEGWLFGRLTGAGAGARARWNVIAQQVIMAQLDRDRDDDIARYNMDKWDGYQVPRARLLAYLATARVPNPVVLSGDIHRHIAAELRPDFSRPETPVVATEFVNTSISSRGDGIENNPRYVDWLRQNPHLKYVQDLRGYVRHTVTPATWHADFKVLDHIRSRDVPIRIDRRFVLEAGRPVLHTA